MMRGLYRQRQSGSSKALDWAKNGIGQARGALEYSVYGAQGAAGELFDTLALSSVELTVIGENMFTNDQKLTFLYLKLVRK